MAVHEPVVRTLVDSGADVNAAIQNNKNTALSLAAAQGRAAVLRLLIDSGAVIDCKTKVSSISHLANLGGTRLYTQRITLKTGK